ncbi:vesicle-associated membrane protein 1 [Hyaloraphidium curvatum]|nr:vesicle-associated membrane protein 1 [Hyaloraphidium curvatum]
MSYRDDDIEAGGSSAAGSSKTAEVQAQVDEVVQIMQQNVNKVVQRGEALESLQTKTDDLQQSSLQFKRGANAVRKEMWWRDMKLKIILGVVIAIILIIVIVVIVTSVNK